MLSVAKRPAQHELAALCRNPVLGIVEFDSACDEARDAGPFRDASTRSDMADFSTETAYDLVLSQVIVWRLEMATSLSGDCRSAVQICLHEGIANASLDGNLEIGSLSKAFDLDNIIEFLKELEGRLSFDDFANRRIRVLAEWSDQKIAFSTTDEGRGFDHRSVMRFRRESRHSPYRTDRPTYRSHRIAGFWAYFTGRVRPQNRRCLIVRSTLLIVLPTRPTTHIVTA